MYMTDYSSVDCSFTPVCFIAVSVRKDVWMELMADFKKNKRFHSYADSQPVSNSCRYTASSSSQTLCTGQGHGVMTAMSCSFRKARVDVHVPSSDDDFTLAGYKAFTGCQYQKLVLFLCNKDDYEAGWKCFTTH